MIKKFILFRRALVCLSAFTCVLNVSNAAFTLVEDFDDLTVGGIAQDNLNGNSVSGSVNTTSGWRSNSTSGQFSVADDISDA